MAEKIPQINRRELTHFPEENSLACRLLMLAKQLHLAY